VAGARAPRGAAAVNTVRKSAPRASAKPVGKVHARLADLYEELAHTHRELSFADVEDEGKPARGRAAPVRPPSERMQRLTPNELQRAKARQIMKAKGLIE
jgi:hypothetical protein